MILFWLLHAFYSTVLAFLLANVFGSLSLTIAIVSLLLGAVMARFNARNLSAIHKDFKFSKFTSGQAGLIEIVMFSFILYASWRHFTWLLFPTSHQLSTLSANNFGDLPLHINFIRAFANGLEFPPVNPIFTAETLRYPYGSDLYNALWEVVGMRLQAHLFLTGIFAAIASLVFLRAFAGWWGVGAFFLNGGVAAWTMMAGSLIDEFQKNIDWKNFFLSVFITQRGMLFALPLGLLLLICVRKHLSGEAPLPKRVLTTLGVIWGFLPLFHLHAFVIISLLLVATSFEQGKWRGVFSFLRSRAALVAYLPATLLVLHSTGYFKAAGVMHFRLGWMAKEGEHLSFLWLNFGPWLLLPLLTLIAIWFQRTTNGKEKTRKLLIEWATYSVLFLIFFNVMLAPWEWDNIKILIWPYLGFTRIAYLVIEPRFGANGIGAIIRPLATVALFFTGFIAVLYTLQTPAGRKVDIYSTADLANAEGALKKIPVNAIFASTTSHLHPLTYFGRLRVHGYEGHLWSHGIDAKEVWTKLDRVLNGSESADDSIRNLKELGVTHIYWGRDEKSVFGEEPKPWMSQLENLSEVSEVSIYQVK